MQGIAAGVGVRGPPRTCLLSPIEHGRSLAWEPPSSTWLSFGPFVLVSPAQGPQGLAPLTSHVSLHISSTPSKLGKGSWLVWEHCPVVQV